MTSLFHILVLFCLLTVHLPPPPPRPSSILFTPPSLTFTTPPLSLSSLLFSSTPPFPAFFLTSSVYLPFVFRSSFLSFCLFFHVCLIFSVAYITNAMGRAQAGKQSVVSPLSALSYNYFCVLSVFESRFKASFVWLPECLFSSV